MTLIRIIKNGKTKEINLTPIEKLSAEYRETLFKRENFSDRKHVDYSTTIQEEIKNLNKDQLKYLICNITGIVNELSDLYQSALDNPEKFLENINTYKKLGIIKNDK